MEDVDYQLEAAETQANEYMDDEESSDSHSLSSAETAQNHSRHPTHIHRWESQVIQHTHTVGSQADTKVIRPWASDPLPEFGANKPYPPEIPAEREAYVVDFAGPNDPLHPMNWPRGKKLTNASLGALASLCSSFASSCLAAATPEIGPYFHVSYEVTTLLSALYLFGYAAGPSIWAPVSELRGRRLPLLLGTFGFSLFVTAVATAKDVQTLMICRFFAGLFGSSPLVVVAAMYVDMYKAEQRGIALVVFCMSVFVGPLSAPFVGGFTVMSYLGWRWDSYWSMIMGFTIFIAMLFFLKETYPPSILVTKAEVLRRRTKNWAIHAKQEEVEVDIMELVKRNISRPIRMLFEEPILLLMGFYITFVYSLIYISITAYPEVFQKKRHWNQGVGSLPLLGMMLGCIGGGCTHIAYNKIWVRKYHANGNRAVPEWRLPVTAFTSVIFAIGLFWFGWTGNYNSVHWIVPTIGGVFIGYGLLGVFIGLICYILDAYLMFAASALAGNTILRSLVAGGCPLFDKQLFDNLGVEWGMTLLGCLAVVMIPVPVLFMRYGPKLREKSKWVPKAPVTPPGRDRASEEEKVKNKMSRNSSRDQNDAASQRQEKKADDTQP